MEQGFHGVLARETLSTAVSTPYSRNLEVVKLFCKKITESTKLDGRLALFVYNAAKEAHWLRNPRGLVIPLKMGWARFAQKASIAHNCFVAMVDAVGLLFYGWRPCTVADPNPHIPQGVGMIGSTSLEV